MAVRPVLVYPHEKLREKCVEVEDVRSDLSKQVVRDLLDTAIAEKAHGLAAPQIGENVRIFVVKDKTITTDGRNNEFKVYINPSIKIEEESEDIKSKEACLSFPGVDEILTRKEDIVVSYKDENNNQMVLCLDGLDSVAFQHENDHLDGVLFIDRMSKLKKKYLLKRFNKLKKRVLIRR